MLLNFCVLIFRKKYFRGLGYPWKYFSTFPGLVIWSKTIHTPGVKTACCIHGYHTAFGKLLTCEREVRNAIGTYCGSKDRRFLGHWGLSRKLSHVCHEPPAVSKRLSHTKQLASSAVKLSHVHKNVLTVMNICYKIFFVFFISVVYANHENTLQQKFPDLWYIQYI